MVLVLVLLGQTPAVLPSLADDLGKSVDNRCSELILKTLQNTTEISQLLYLN